jgi:DNA-binding protein HU-beta
MTKTELIKKIAEDAEIDQKAAAMALKAVFNGITNALKSKEGKASFIGFGTFKKTKRKARTGRNPKTGEAIKIKASNGIHFKPGKALKESI